MNKPLSQSTVKAYAGDTAVLRPLEYPGSLIQQYFIDWRRNGSLETIASIQGPRSGSTVPSSDMYTVDPDNFELIIPSVSRDDQGLYFGVLGVRDPGGSSFFYTETESRGILLEVFG